MIKKIKLVLIIGISPLWGFEVNMHQAITRCAVTPFVPQCSTEGVENLETFVQNTNLNTKVYEKEIFESYGDTYKKYVEGITPSGFQNWKIKINPNYRGMIEAGVILEDSVYPHSDHGGDGRFNNHFYAAQIPNTKEVCKKEGFNMGPQANYQNMKSTKAVCGGYATRTDNIDWVFNNKVNVNWNGRTRKNDYGIDDAFHYFEKSFQGNEDDRKKYQAKLFVTLGFMVHMLQDLHSPAHVRDNAHANGDYLEIYGRYKHGFRLINGLVDTQNNHDIEKAMRDYNRKDFPVPLGRLESRLKSKVI